MKTNIVITLDTDLRLTSGELQKLLASHYNLTDYPEVAVNEEIDHDVINDLVKIHKDTSEVSDGYHTFDQLYRCRHALFIALAKELPRKSWKSIRHDTDDNPMYDGWFVMGINMSGGPITFHLPIHYWGQLESIKTLDNAPAFDGHNTEDVIDRLANSPVGPKLPPQFAEENVSEGTTLFGIPIEDLSKEQLLCTISYMETEHKRDKAMAQRHIKFSKALEGLQHGG